MDDFSNGDSITGNDSSMMGKINDNHSDIDGHERNYSHSDTENGHDHEMASNKKESSKKSKTNDNDSNVHKRSPHKESKSSRSKIDLSKTRYMWVSGIPAGTKTSQLEDLFTQHGKVLAIKIIRSGTDSSLLGFVKMDTIEQARKCMEKLHNAEFRGVKITLSKERPVDKDAPKKVDNKSGNFRDNNNIKPFKPFVQRSTLQSRPFYRNSPPRHARGHFIRTPVKPHFTREYSNINTPVFRRDDFLEREKERIQMERERLEREKEELRKMERETRVFEHPSRDRVLDDKRVRPLGKRPLEEHGFGAGEKRYDTDYHRRDEYRARIDTRTSPERKLPSSRSFTSTRPRYEEGSRNERHSEKYHSSKPTSITGNHWQAPSSDSHHRWHSSSSSSNYDTSSRVIASNIGSSSHRIHTNSDLSHGNSRSYFSSSSSRRY